MAHRLNLAAAARMIQDTPPAKLEGLYQAVSAKCEALGIVPGRRDTASPVEAPDGGTVNLRGILNFVDSCEALHDDDEILDTELVTEADELTAGDSLAKAAERNEVKNRKLEQQRVKKERKEAKLASHKLLAKLLGTLAQRFAAAGYTPKPKPETLS